MTTTQRAEQTSNVTAENTNANPILSLDWLAVISALILAAVVFFGLSVTW